MKNITLGEFLNEYLKDTACFTIGAEDGHGWLFYAENGSIENMPPQWMMERPVLHFYFRKVRDEETTCCALKEGLAIIIEGEESGSI